MLEAEMIVPIHTDGHEGHWYGAPVCEIVRCRDCKYCKRRVDGYACRVRPLMQHVVDTDGYCSDGERREPESP